MNRRLFSTSLTMSALAFATGSFAFVASAIAQESSASPEATPEDNKIPLSSQPGFVLGVSRTFVVPDPGFSDLTNGLLLNLQGSGIEFDTPDNAAATLEFLRTAIPAYYTDTTEGVIASDVTDEPIDDFGDERIAQTLTLTLDNDVFSQFEFGIVLIRKGPYLQFLTGFSTERATEQTLELAATLDDRWPSDDLWDIVPTTQDVPTTMTFDEEKVTEPNT